MVSLSQWGSESAASRSGGGTGAHCFGSATGREYDCWREARGTPRKRNTEEQTCQFRMTAHLMVMARSLTGALYSIGQAFVAAITGQRVLV